MDKQLNNLAAEISGENLRKLVKLTCKGIITLDVLAQKFNAESTSMHGDNYVFLFKSSEEATAFMLKYG